MEELLKLLNATYALHPKMEIGDGVKFIFQNEMGPGHLVPDIKQAKERTEDELKSCGENSEPALENLGNNLYRLNLPSFRGKLSGNTIGAMFALTSSMVTGNKSRLAEKLSLLRELPFPKAEAESFLERYTAAGCPVQSHSETYRKEYNPAYRLIHRNFAQSLDAFIAVEKLVSSSLERIIISIDGDCASGKSTLGRLLAAVYDGNLFCADDYFLPAEKRTAERLSEPGGNMDRERLFDEVIAPLKAGLAPSIRRFDCHTMTLGQWEHFPQKRVNIVEGSYSQHPLLRSAYNLNIAVTTDPETQLRRIAGRDGEGALPAFRERWIPMEKKCFEYFSTFESADVVITT